MLNRRAFVSGAISANAAAVPPSGMDRRRFLLTLLGALAAPLAAGAQQMRRIAFISATSLSPTLVKDVEDALREVGWAPGRNIIVEYRSAEGQYNRLPGLIEDVLRRNPEVILSVQTPTTQAIRKLTDAVPIVMVGHGDPIRYGIVTNLARPENNITGVSFLADELGIKALELLTVRDAAARLKVHLSRVRALVRSGALPCVRVGRYVRVQPAAVRAFVATHEQAHEQGLAPALSIAYNPTRGRTERSGPARDPSPPRADARPIRAAGGRALEHRRPLRARRGADLRPGRDARATAWRRRTRPPDPSDDETQW